MFVNFVADTSIVKAADLHFALNFMIYHKNLFDLSAKNFVNFVVAFFTLLKEMTPENLEYTICSLKMLPRPPVMTKEIENFFRQLYQMPEETETYIILLTESMIPFIKLLCPVFDIPVNRQDEGQCFEIGDDFFVFRIQENTIRRDSEGILFKELEKTPVSENGVRSTTPAFIEGLEKLLKSPPFTDSEPTLEELKELSSKKSEGEEPMGHFKPLTSGVSKPPDSPPVSYSEATSRATPDTPLPSIPEEVKEEEVKEEEVKEEEVKEEEEYFEGRLYIPTGKDMCFINRNKGVKTTIFCSRFYGYKHLKNHQMKIPLKYLEENRNPGKESQFYPKTGFMKHLQIKIEDDWKYILEVPDTLP